MATLKLQLAKLLVASVELVNSVSCQVLQGLSLRLHVPLPTLNAHQRSNSEMSNVLEGESLILERVLSVLLANIAELELKLDHVLLDSFVMI